MFKFVQLGERFTVNGCVVFILPSCSWSGGKVLKKATSSFHEDGFSFVLRFWFLKYFLRFFWLMLFWTAKVSLESLHCVECVVSLLTWKLRGGNWILPAVSALPAWRKNKHTYWEQWTFIETLGGGFLPFFFLKTKKRPCWGLQAQVAWPRGFSPLVIWLVPCSGHKGCNWLASTFWSLKCVLLQDIYPLFFFFLNLCLTFSLQF